MTGADFSVAPQLAGLLAAIMLYAAVAVFAAVFHPRAPAQKLYPERHFAGVGIPSCGV